VPELNLCQFALTKRWDKLERETAVRKEKCVAKYW
jgi:hypothetical protein